MIRSAVIGGFALLTGTVNAAVILAMDGGGTATNATSHSVVDDFSTGGDSIGSINPLQPRPSGLLPPAPEKAIS